MARPKRNEGVSALARLEQAFWELLAEMPYAGITLSTLCKRAKINHNTFYYYYENLDEMATRLIEQNLIPDLPYRLWSGLLSEKDISQAMLDDENQRHFQRACLVVGPHGSTWMRDSLKDAVMVLWLESLGLRQEELRQNEGMLLSFAVGGILSVVGDYGQKGDLAEFKVIMESDLGKGLLASIRKLTAGI